MTKYPTVEIFNSAIRVNQLTLCRQGGAVFFSTHVLDVAERLCNKVAIIRQGHLVAAGETAVLTGGKTLEETFMEVVRHGETDTAGSGPAAEA